MRDIIFRGKRVEDGKWIYGYLSFFYIDNPEKGRIYSPKEVRRFDVMSETVGQYTGLCDRDGRKIFEGDIVTVFYNPNYIGVSKDRVGNFIVVFHDACFMKRKITKPMSGDAGLYHFIQSDEFKVIGNIFDNPELLESDIHKAETAESE